MKTNKTLYKFGIAALAVILVVFFRMEGFAEPKTKLKTEKEKVSYSIGLSIGANFKRQLIEIEINSLMQGIKDALAEAKPKMTQEEIKTTMELFRRKMEEKINKKREAESNKNMAAGKNFLAKNKTRDNVVTLPSGLQYEILKKGKGKKPTINSTVVTHYKGTLINGKEFDSSIKRGKPAEFPVNGVIKGWTEALQLMNVGDKWKLFVPADLAYGSRGAGAAIGPNETLIFEIELLEVKK